MRKLLPILLLISAPSLFGQAWSGVLDPSRGIDWSSVGATISTTRTQCVTTQCATVTGGTVTASSVNAALASAPANTYVLIPAGSFTMSAGLTFANHSNVTLRGSGSNSTFLTFTSGSNSGNCNGHDVCASSSDTNYAGGPTNTANWTAGYSKGATSITLSSKTNLTVGNPIILDQIDDQTDNAGLYVGCEQPDGSAACYSGAGPNGFERGSSLPTIRGQQQIVNVTSISGSGPYTIGITPGLYAPNWRTGQTPGAWWATSPVAGDAVENISLDHTNGGDGITFFNCTGCWVKGIRSITTSTGGTGWNHVAFSICNHCTVRDSYHFGYDGDDYGFTNLIGSDNLWENNIGQKPAEDFFSNSDCEGCVSTYNFTVNPWFSSSSNWLSQPSFFHGVQLFSLQEGNIGAGIYEDSFHGTHVLNTQFRNRWDGHEQNNGSTTNSGTVALRLNPGARYDNVVGNVLGTVGYHSTYKAVPSSTNDTTSVITAGIYPEGSTNDALVAPTSMFWGNWDNVSNAVRWCGNSGNTGWGTTCSSTSEVPTGLGSYANAVPATQTLPASFIYSSRPSWWPSSKAWPSIGPDVTGGNVGQCVGGTYATSQATSAANCSAGAGTLTPLTFAVSNPAMDCYLNVMGGVANGTGSPLLYDPAACYTYSLNSTGLDDELTTWKAVCVLSACDPGGIDTPASTTQTINNVSPSLDGHSMLISETTNATSTQTNALWAQGSPGCDACTNFTSDFQVYVTSGTNASALEFDSYQFNFTLNRMYMWGMQCLACEGTGTWQIANDTSGWTNTGVTKTLTSGTWHHIVTTYHRIPGDTSCSGVACNYYDTLSIDGTVHVLNLTEPSEAIPNGWAPPSVAANQFQIDIGATSGSAKTASMNLDEVSFTGSIGAPAILPPTKLTGVLLSGIQIQ